MKSTALLSLVLGLSLGACLDGAEDEVGTTNTDKIAMNSLLPTSFIHLVPSTQLTSASAQPQISTPNGRSSMAYFTTCALGSGQSVTYTYQGIPYTFQGLMGVATAWTTRDLTVAEANAVSSCINARMNRDGIAINISLRGSNPGFATTGTELTGYTLQEGAFWGNSFSNLGAITSFACIGTDKIAWPNLGDMANRHCTEQDPNNTYYTQCGQVYAGPCTSVCTLSSGYYTCTYNGNTITDAATIFVNNGR